MRRDHANHRKLQSGFGKDSLALDRCEFDVGLVIETLYGPALVLIPDPAFETAEAARTVVVTQRTQRGEVERCFADREHVSLRIPVG